MKETFEKKIYFCHLRLYVQIQTDMSFSSKITWNYLQISIVKIQSIFIYPHEKEISKNEAIFNQRFGENYVTLN